MHNLDNHILVLGGHGFVGRYVVKHLQRMGTNPLVGTRGIGKPLTPGDRRAVFHEMHTKRQWKDLLVGVRVVVNCVGILRERKGETFEHVHHHSVALLAEACRDKGIRIIHVSALGLENPVTSLFSLTKKRGEDAIRQINGDWYIVRASIVDATDGYGSGWFRRIAKWPVHFAPGNSTSEISPIAAEDLGYGLARLALRKSPTTYIEKRIYEVGCGKEYSVFDYLYAISGKKPICRVSLPGWVTRLTTYICDYLHLTPLTFGHYELLQYRNAPRMNTAEELLGRSPMPIEHQNCIEVHSQPHSHAVARTNA